MEGLLDQSETKGKATRNGCCSRPAQRWCLVAIIFAALLTTGYLYPGRRSREPLKTTGIQDRPLSHTSISVPFYLLGLKEDATKLWFPPDARQSNFSPAVAAYNVPPPALARLRTPLFIAFTRNNAMLNQAVLSYIAAGWPREDIIIIDNSGTMDANPLGLLTPENPFFLNYTLFREHYGISILQTPVLLTFAQLMNFYLRVSMAHGWEFFFWSHMDVAILSDEDTTTYKSFHARVLEILDSLGFDYLAEGRNVRHKSGNWALKYFSYDWLTLVNVPAWRTIGSWDTFIPYYATDCDAYSRIVLEGFTKSDAHAGHVFDLPQAIEYPEQKFFAGSEISSAYEPAEDAMQPGSQRYYDLLEELKGLGESKSKEAEGTRNSWQRDGQGGAGEPFTYDPQGFQKMWWKSALHGREMFRAKWGISECNLNEHGVTLDNAWSG